MEKKKKEKVAYAFVFEECGRKVVEARDNEQKKRRMKVHENNGNGVGAGISDAGKAGNGTDEGF